MYSPIYLEPTFRKEDLQQSLDELDERRYQPIKAATNEQTSLSSYDPVVACVYHAAVYHLLGPWRCGGHISSFVLPSQ